MDGWMDGWMDGCGWMDGWMHGWMKEITVINTEHIHVYNLIITMSWNDENDNNHLNM
jgi:hypothetical protein